MSSEGNIKFRQATVSDVHDKHVCVIRFNVHIFNSFDQSFDESEPQQYAHRPTWSKASELMNFA